MASPRLDRSCESSVSVDAKRTGFPTDSDSRMNFVKTSDLFISNFPKDVTEDEIITFLKDFNPLNVKKYQRDIKCFAFVQLSSHNDVLQAVRSNGTMFRGRKVIIRPCIPQGNGKKSPDFSKSPATQDRDLRPAAETPETDGDQENVKAEVYISNLPMGVTKVELEHLLQHFEPVSIRHYSRDLKSFAFAQLSSTKKVPITINKINGSIFNGHRLNCQRVKQRSPRKPSDSSEKQMELPALEEVQSSEFLTSKAVQEPEVCVDNLPGDVTEEDILTLFQSYKPVHVKTQQHGGVCFAVVQLSSPEFVSQAVRCLNGVMFKGCPLKIQSMQPKENEEDVQEPSRPLSPMPELEYVPASDWKENYKTACDQMDNHSLTVPAMNKSIYAVPMEMRGVFILHMLRDCYNNLNWLAALMCLNGEAALLVTNVFPQMPYFWAILLSEDKYAVMMELFQGLAELESKLPFLSKSNVQKGICCLAPCVLVDGEEASWNRCWVVDTISDLAIVFFLDYGLTANVPIGSLRQLDDEKFWVAPPLAQPFKLEEGCCSSCLVRTILKGEIKGFCNNERHILTFSSGTAEE